MRIFLLSFLTLFFSQSYSQDTTLIVDKKFKQSTLPKSYKAITTVEQNSGNLHLTLVDNKSIDRYIIDSNWKIISQFSSLRGMYSPLPFNRFNNMRIIASGQKEFGIYSTDSKKFEIDEIDFPNQSEVNIANIEVGKKESAISSFTTNNIFCLITASKKSAELNIISNGQRGGISFDTITVVLNILNKNLSAAKLMDDAVVIKPGERSPERLSAANKIYYSGNTVYISNEHHDATCITEVNLKTGNIKQKIFKQQFDGDMTEAIKGRFNSFLNNNILVNGNLYNAALSVSFYDYNNENRIKTYTVSGDDTINFKNSAVTFEKAKKFNLIFEKSPIVFKNGKNLTDAKQFIKKALKGQLALSLSNKTKDQVELVVEIYYEPVGGGGGGLSPRFPGGSFSTPGGMVNLPSTPGYFSSGGFGYSSYEKSTHFKCLFQPGTFEHIQDMDETMSTDELIENELNDDDKSVITIFEKNNFLYMGFYEKKNDVYIIKRMGKLVED